MNKITADCTLTISIITLHSNTTPNKSHATGNSAIKSILNNDMQSLLSFEKCPFF